MSRKTYIENIIALLREFADKNYQKRVWVNGQSIVGDMSISFDEAMMMLFDDSVVDDQLKDREIIVSSNVTNILQELSDLVDKIDTNRPQEEIINDPLMQVVREKAAYVLALIKASDGSESTVRFVKVGTPDTPISIEDAFKNVTK